MEAIIDIEIANRMTRLDWDNKKADIICIGALLLNKGKPESIIQLIKTKEMSKEDFADNIRILLNSLSSDKLWALNAPFEQEAIEAYTGNRYIFHEVRHGLHGALSSKEALYRFLFEKGLVKGISDPYMGDSSMVQGSYAEYLHSGAWIALQQILAHNVNCLLKEFHILQNIDFIMANTIKDKMGYIDRFR
jgi:hypothetical protein